MCVLLLQVNVFEWCEVVRLSVKYINIFDVSNVYHFTRICLPLMVFKCSIKPHYKTCVKRPLKSRQNKDLNEGRK